MTDQKTVSVLLCTSGDGFWSGERTAVRVTGLAVTIWNSPDSAWGELRAYFDPLLWDTDRMGLIYTDSLWMAQFREWVGQNLGAATAGEVDYSEQGMQGHDYVSMDITEVFIQAWQAAGWPVAQQVVLDY